MLTISYLFRTDEMRPAWYSVDDIPYAQMWEDDPYWLPLLVAGTPFIGRADFDAKPGKQEYPHHHHTND